MHTLAVARAVHGIEPLVAAEIQRSGLGSVRALRHREVWFDTADPGPALLGLRTADDVLLAAAVVDGIGHDRTALRRLARAARELDAGSLSGRGPGVEVSASFVGRRNYTRFEIEDAVGAELARRTRLPYHSRAGGGVPPRGSVAWRVTIEGERALIALRASGTPLHRRPYKTGSIAGTLHPPLAAAMSQLGRLGEAGTVLDPCCGAGTTLIEACAFAPRARLLGLDHAPGVVATAAANAARAGRQSRLVWAVADGGRLPVAGASVDRVLVNPPWGRQVPPAGLLARDPGLLWREVRRVLADDGVVVALLHDLPQDPRGFEAVRRVAVSLSGRHPVLTVLRKRGRASRG
ncbi:methyltransferase domain-containing protein [Nonomuraea sp. LPB2021202275-12-8]|uniref:methyltransferase domain-containing protein n=1 Tax=Nonomuraea sp. LPB2021202275-12-8 TaxID=3120159 RepID=UPI00300D21A8